MADLIPISMGIPWDPWDPSLSHSHAHLYTDRTVCALLFSRVFTSYLLDRLSSLCPPVQCLNNFFSVMQPLKPEPVKPICLFKVHLTGTYSLKAVLKRVYGWCINIFPRQAVPSVTRRDFDFRVRQ